MANSQEQLVQGTLSQNNTNNLTQWTPEIDLQSRPWGQLILIQRKIKTLGIKHSNGSGDTSSHIFDLHNDTYSVGKYNCDITLSTKLFSSDVLNQISRKHFILKRDLEGCGPVILEDLSHNGTFVNGEKIGRGNKRIIESLDEIVLADKYSRIFVFHDWISMTSIEVPTCVRIVYYISKQIGNGTSGMVHLVFNKRTCVRYAMKIEIKGNEVGEYESSSNHKRIMNEVKILKKLTHPFIISICDVVDTPKKLYLVMEYMDRGDLQCYITEKSLLEENEAKHIFYQIAEAIKYLHNQKIIHRDLKPQNILLRNCPKYNIIAKVSDFGLSKFIGESYLKSKCGTPLYNAPEVVKNLGGYTEKADIWSLGVILYFSLRGKEPFSRTDLENQIYNAAFSLNDECCNTISPCARDLVLKMLVLDINDRLSITEVLQHDWLKVDIAVQELLVPKFQNLTPKQISSKVEKDRFEDCTDKDETVKSDQANDKTILLESDNIIESK